jgi:hypothetical protein
MDSTGAGVGGKVKKGAAGCKTGGPRKTRLQFPVEVREGRAPVPRRPHPEPIRL